MPPLRAALSRAPLYLASLRTIIRKALGMSASAYSAKQLAVAKAMWDVLRTRFDEASSAAVLGCCEGECSFVLLARGDHGEAGGAFQWHAARRDGILAHSNPAIDVWTAGAPDQARAFMAETGTRWPGNGYSHVGDDLARAPTLEAKMRVLVHEFEQSGSQDRDVARRTPMAAQWLQRFGTQVTA